MPGFSGAVGTSGGVETAGQKADRITRAQKTCANRGCRLALQWTYRQRHEAAAVASDTGSVLALSVDGKGIVMRPQDLREQTRKAAENRTHKMDKRLSRGEKKNAKRMATVSTVYTIPPVIRSPEDVISGDFSGSQRPSPEHKRVWASIKKTPEEVIAEMFEEARARDPGHEKKWVALVDGNKPQIRTLRRSATKRHLEPETRKPVDKCAKYLINHKPYLRYDRYLAQGLPIATGVIEGACRHLVKDRMEITGARWSLTGAEAILSLRALRSNRDFEEYWRFHEACEYERTHRSKYDEGIVPNTIKPAAPCSKKKHAHLRRIK